MISPSARRGIAASVLLSLLLLPAAFALRPGLPDAAPGLGIGHRAGTVTPLATRELIREMAAQGLKGLGLRSEDASRLATRAVALAMTEDGAREMDNLAADAAALGASDAIGPRDVLARVETLVALPLVTTDTVGRAFGVDATGSGREAHGGPALAPGLSPGNPDAMLGGTCQTCPAFDFGPFTPTPSYQFHSSAISAGGADCNWYAFDVDAMATYEFSLCSPGSAPFDTVLELFSPLCGFLASSDDSCGAQSLIQYTSSTTTSLRLKVRGFGGASGPYNLAYRRVCIGEPNCASPDSTLADPLTSCQYQSGTVSGCSNARFYAVDLIQGQTYTFSLCSATCASAGASFDSAIELFDPSGALLVSDSSACGDDGEVTFTADPITGAGTYCVVVRSAGGTATDFNLGFRVACQAPSGVTIGPASSSTAEADCTRDMTFTSTTGGTGPFNWTWTITPTGSQSASPAAGTDTTSANTLSFDSTLTGSGDYTVSVTVANDCGSDGQSITFNLEDRAGPVLTPTADKVTCGSSIRSASAPGPAAPATSPLRATQRLTAMSENEMADLIAIPDPDAAAEALAAKLGVARKSLVVLDRRTPGVVSAPGTMALACGSPCTGFGTLQADSLFYDVFLNCDDGSFTARTGVAHSVTLSSGMPQNVIFGGSGGSPGTSDASWFVHDSADHYINPTGGSACLFNPPDTSVEPGSIGLEAEWTRNPTGMPGVTVRLREEIVTFGDTEANSGVRLTLGATNLASSPVPVTMGVRWQIDYQNAFDDGPLFAGVTCSPFEVFGERSTEHEYTDAEVDGFDFYRIQNNTSSPIFGNFTNTAAISGFPDTGKPDRLTYARWGSVVGTGWNYNANEGDPSPDSDSAVLYWFGFAAADGITLVPGETFARSVIIFTAGDNQDCGAFRAGECETQAVLEICPNECARIGATAFDGCGGAGVLVELVAASAGAPTCIGNPCVASFPDEGTFIYTWRATDAAGNVVECTSTVIVADGPDCNVPPTCNAGGPATSECRDAPVEGAFVDDLDGDEITYSWTTSDPMVTVEPVAGVIGAGAGPRSLPPTVARLDSSVDPCGVTATLTLRVDDGRGGGSSCTTVVVFNDTTPPTVGSTAGGSGGPSVCLWPPNHWYVPVTTADLGVFATDNCTATTFVIVGCVSDQPEDAPERNDVDQWNGDGHTLNDCVVSADGQSVMVRSERCGRGTTAQDGRHYGIAVMAADACGNLSAPTVVGAIHVPHDQSPAEDGCLNPTEIGTQELP